MTEKRIFLRFVVVFVVLLAGVLVYLWYEMVGQRERNYTPIPPVALDEVVLGEGYGVLATNLVIPWSVGVLPEGEILLTERDGRVRLLDPRQGLLPEPVHEIEEVSHRGEGGLLGLAVHPQFARTRTIYLYYTYEGELGVANKVVAYTLENQSLSESGTIIDGIPAARTHNGGRIKFGPDNLLYITTGDAQIPEAAQDLTSLAGKILRVRDDGSWPADNPFEDSPIYSYGHRNPQGLAWDAEGNLWATEHGGVGHDELNLITAGTNYGWPVIEGDEEAVEMAAPVLHSGTDTWAPSGADVAGAYLYFAGLRGNALYRFNLDPDNPELTTHLEGTFGRLREVVASPDGMLYILTNNRDGRGLPASEDDLLLAIDPERL